MKNKNFISFADPNFFGQTFQRKYEAFKEQQAAALNFQVDYSKIIPTLVKIIGMEASYKPQLEQMAVTTAKELFPVIDIAKIQIEAEISYEISHTDLSPRGTPNFPKPTPKDNPELYKKIAKQKILNAITQGAGVSMNSIHHMNSEAMNHVSPFLIENYDVLMKSNEAAYLNIPTEHFARMAMMANDHNDVGGTNKVEFRNGVPYIVARAKNYVNLVHEIIKGVYTYLTLNAYDDVNEYYEITEYTDSIYSEIEDIGCGKMLLNALRTYLLDNFEKYYEHPSFFEMFIVALSKLPADDVVSLTEGILNGNPNRSKFEVLARNCYYDLKDYEKNKYVD